MVVANTLFATMALSAKLAAKSASWATIGAGRALVGALVALAFALRSGGPLRPRNRPLSWARSILGTLAMLATFYAIGSPSLAVGDAATLLATSPILMAILSPWILGEKPGARLWIVLVVAFAGVLLIAGPKLGFSGLPAASAMLAAVFSALAMMFLRKMRSAAGGDEAGEPESTPAIALHYSLVAFATHAVFAVGSFRSPSAAGWAWLVVAGLTGGLAQLAMTRAYALTEAARLGATGYLGTVMTFAGGVLFLDERPGLAQVVGALLVVGAGVALALGGRDGRSHPPPRARALSTSRTSSSDMPAARSATTRW
jgi:drug/metabolite transporter (DMT)-like permease